MKRNDNLQKSGLCDRPISDAETAVLLDKATNLLNKGTKVDGFDSDAILDFAHGQFNQERRRRLKQAVLETSG